ncbi:elongation factor P [Candidatus Legionella polyplacis]|uniref:elongation factor P n=1 Tax=Candidatus Legionella polyplacis TaxID=2005262 RepID=UPI000C1EDAEC|nr:elongation factor P [Candidatus Legionella polyplacis]ATW01777.1 elongation factor P [Candidatus Legionella polyplacis]
MINYHTNEFKIGTKIIVDNDPYIIIESHFIKPGKGQAFVRIKIRNLKNNQIIERTYKAGEKLPAANIVDINVQYLYQHLHTWNFININNFEQYELKKNDISNIKIWLKEEEIYTLTLWNKNPIHIIAPNFINFFVIETNPNFKNQISKNGNKIAILETGLKIRVPNFIQKGDFIKVDTRTKEYICRIK